ncbi:MAG: YdcF family protein [Vicinamibacterales bacterium]
MKKLARVGRILLAVTGGMTLLIVGWLLTDWPLGVDAPLNVSEAPRPADVIVCIGAGTTQGSLPTDDGWARIFAASQLYLDGYAPVVVFSGRGSEKLSEAEVYARAAEWLGVPRPAIRIDTGPGSTAEHPVSLLRPQVAQITRDTRMLLVTSALHSRRTLLTFRKQGFTSVQVVSSWHARATGGRSPVLAAPSTVTDYSPSGKSYGDPLFRLRQRSQTLLIALREWVAIAGYWWRGDV